MSLSRRAFPLLLGLVLNPALSPPAQAHAESAWETLASGLELRRHVGRPGGPAWPALVWLVRFDPRRFHIEVLMNPEGRATRVAEVAARPDVLAVINANFFLKDGSPLGLVVSEGKTLRALGRSGWGGLSVDREGHVAVWPAAVGPEGTPWQAIQAGPVLVTDGIVNAGLKRQIARRSFVGIDAQGRVVMGVTLPLPTDARALARFLAAPESVGGVGLVAALNLDGGSSSQLHVRGGRGEDGPLHLPGGVRVPVLLAVTAASD